MIDLIIVSTTKKPLDFEIDKNRAVDKKIDSLDDKPIDYKGIPGEIRSSSTAAPLIPGEGSSSRKPSTKFPMVTPGMIPGEGMHILLG